MKLSYETKDNLIMVGVIALCIIGVPIGLALLIVFGAIYLAFALIYAIIMRIMPRNGQASETALALAHEKGRLQGWKEATEDHLKSVGVFHLQS